MRLLILLVLCSNLLAEGHKLSRLYKASVAALVAGATVDTVTSIGGIEDNPILGRGRFGNRQIAIKSALTGGLVITQYLVMRHRQDDSKAAIVNFAIAGGLTGVAISNRVRR